MAKKILLGLTTITAGEWKNKVKEIDELGLKEIALFPTCLNIKERQELYRLLEKTKLEKIPHVHLRSDMELFELDYLTAKYKTEVFNIHSSSSLFPFLVQYNDYDKRIYIENTPGDPPTENDLKKYAGLCLDLSHWEITKLEAGEAGNENLLIKKFADKHRIGCNHISGIKPKKKVIHDRFLNKDFSSYGSHWLDDLSEVDYVKKYQNYLAEIISLEFENPLKRQLEVKEYLEKILNLE